MENQQSPNGPNREHHSADALQSGTKRRRRISYSGAGPLISSDQIETEKSEIPEPEAGVTEEDLLLLGDPDLDQDNGADELPGTELYLDDTDFDDDPLNEESGLRAGSGSDLDVPDDELDNAGSALESEDEENDFFGHLDDADDSRDFD